MENKNFLQKNLKLIKRSIFIKMWGFDFRVPVDNCWATKEI